MSNLFIETLPEKTAKLVSLFNKVKPSFLDKFYLSGGTALSLQIGHRESEDLDFFIREMFKPGEIEQELLKFGSLSETELSHGTVNTFLNGVKLQFLYYPYDILDPFILWNDIQLSSVVDIACTKLQTVGMRGSKKDFIDLYFLFKQFSLTELFNYTSKKYSKSDYSEAHILKSLVYFDDAEDQPMPRMHQNISWEDVKKTMISAVKSIQFS